MTHENDQLFATKSKPQLKCVPSYNQNKSVYKIKNFTFVVYDNKMFNCVVKIISLCYHNIEQVCT